MNLAPVSRLWRLLADLLFPPRCVACASPGALLCASCLASVATFAEARCPRCDVGPLPGRAPARCPKCRSQTASALAGWRTLGPHADPLRSAIHALKYERRRALAAPLGELLATRWQISPPDTVDGILPVPLHPDRQRERGFNQSALLAATVAPLLGVPLREELLWRERATRPQVGLGREARQANVAGAFRAAPAAAGGRWLLVDDVCTTGATVEASAQALRDAGAQAVWALTLVRAAGHPS